MMDNRPASTDTNPTILYILLALAQHLRQYRHAPVQFERIGCASSLLSHLAWDDFEKALSANFRYANHPRGVIVAGLEHN